MDVKLLAAGGLLAGVGIGAYLLLNRPNAGPAPANLPAPGPSPITPPPLPPVAETTDLMCAQVMTKCADGSWASTPCGCRDRGGVAPEQSTVVETPTPSLEVIAMSKIPQNFIPIIESVFARQFKPPAYSDIENAPPAWDRSEGPLWS